MSTQVPPSRLDSTQDFSSLVPAAYGQANSAGSFANGAFTVANSAAIFANAAFTAANNATDTWVRNQANSAFSAANAAFTAANNASGAVTSSVPKVSSIAYGGDDTATDTAGGRTVTLTGSGFAAGASILINGSYAPVVTVVSNTSITFTTPAQNAGTYALYVINTDGGTGIVVPGISYSGTPVWTNSAGSLATLYETQSVNTQLSATGDAPVTYSLYSGSLPPGSSLNTSTGLLSGTSQSTSSSTTYSFVIRATDAQLQDTERAFSITINPDVVTFSSPTNNQVISSYEYAAISNVTAAATSAAGYGVLYSANAVPTGITLDPSSGLISGTINTVGNTYSRITGTANTTTRTSTRDVVFNVNQDVVTWSSPADGTTTTLNQNQAMTAVTLSATSAAGKSISYSANALPTGVTISGSSVSGTPTVIANTTSVITATAATTNRTATRTFYWVVQLGGDAYWSNTTTLLSADSSTQTASFANDNSNNNAQSTVVGDTRASNFNPYQLGYYSNYFDGTGDYLTTPANAAFQFGTGDFTIEAWVYLSAGTSGTIFDNRTGTTSLHPVFYFTSATTMQYYVAGTGAITSGSYTFLNRWVHVALCRASGSTKMFFDGVQTGSTYTDTNNYSTSGTVGTGGGLAGVNLLTGYISNLRVIKGTALYTTTFTPSTTPLAAVTNTQLLTCQSNRLIDCSTNKFALTKNGDVTVSATTPFTTKYIATATANTDYANASVSYTGTEITTYGSAYFDGTGDYLTLTNPTAVGSGSFTMECWVYLLGTPSVNYFIYGYRNGADTSPYLFINSSRAPVFGGDITTYVTGSAIPLNTWTHIAVVRNGTSMTLYQNGVSAATGTISQNFSYTGTINIGFANGANAYYFYGYISNLRVVVDTAVYTNNFVPQFTSPLTAVANTQLLTCQTNGPHNSSTFKDTSIFNNIVTRTGNTAIGTFSPYGDNWSNYFDGTTDYLTTGASAANLLTGDFTVEMWIYPTSIPAQMGLIGINNTTSSGASNFGISVGTNKEVKFFVAGNATEYFSASNIITINAWNHISFVRSGSTNTVYVNGTSVITNSATPSFSGTPVITVGRYYGDNTGVTFYGYISNVRVVKGTAIVPTAGGPTSPLTAVANTHFLSCHSNRLIDGSPNNFAITKSGDVSVQKFSPFSSVTLPKYYSTSFNGSTDYLTIPNNVAWTFAGDFTIEAWVYPFTIGAHNTIAAQWNSAPLGWLFKFVSSGRPYFGYRFGGSTIAFTGTTTSVTANQWNHIAVTRSGTTVRLFVNGIVDSTTSTVSGTLDASTSIITIGSTNATPIENINGHISNLRIINGTALYTSNYTPSTSPLTAVSGTQLLTCQSATIIDNSTNNFTITAATTTVKPLLVSPFTPTANTRLAYSSTVFGGSMYFDGTGDYLTLPYLPSYDIPASSQFTFECWVYTTSTNTFVMADRNWSYGGTGPTWSFHLNSGVTPSWGIAGTGSATYVMATSSISGTLGQWNHYAYTRDSSGVVRIFVNGIIGASRTDTQAMSSASGSIYVGVSTNLASPYALGYMSDMRMSPSCLYNSNFYPGPAPATPIAYPSGSTTLANTAFTSLLLTGTNSGVIDLTRNNNFESIGDVKVVNKSPYASGQSYYFDGTGDYLSAFQGPHFALPGDYTIEAWVYRTDSGTQRAIVDLRGGANLNILFYMLSGGQLAVFNSTSTFAQSAGVIPLNQWTHVAVTRSGTSVRLFINGGIDGTATNSDVNVSSGPAYIGRQNGSATNDWLGYITDVRITKGYARYTANIAVPTTAFLAS